MGIADLRNAFISELPQGWRVTDCELHTVPDSGNQQQIIVNGFDATGKPFAQDSTPFAPSENPIAKAREMARGLLNSAANPTQPPVVAAKVKGTDLDYREKMQRARGVVGRANAGIHKMLDGVLASEEQVAKATEEVGTAHQAQMGSKLSDLQTMLHDLAEFSNGMPSPLEGGEKVEVAGQEPGKLQPDAWMK